MTKTQAWKVAGGAALTGLAATALALPPFADWSAPVSIETLSGSSLDLNTGAIDGCASHSRDGLTLYFNSNREGNHNIYMATRPDTSTGFGAPVKLPAPVNTSANDSCPTIVNGNRLYFSSDRDDPSYDIYVARLGPKGWSTPQNLGSNINRDGWLDETADFYEDDAGNEVMVFSSRLTNGSEGKIWQSVNGGMRELVGGGPHSSASDNRPSVTNDGLTIFFDSTRLSSLGPEIFYATRSNTSEPFGTAQHLADLGGVGFDARPFISWDGRFMTYSSARAGSPDMYITTRTRANGKD
ncbi:MAG TPA: hypothetical protein VFK50_09510 [Sphingomicrobium sp.]|nr:hypothetical protein [Sphingomicrobium sp.]